DFDGIDTWVPATERDKKALLRFIDRHGWTLVAHQHQAEGSSFRSFRASYRQWLMRSAELHPVIINSHTGRDYFSYEQNIQLVDIAADFTAKTGIDVAHETHRGRLGYSPYQLKEFFAARPGFHITADFSHWVCVTESMLQGCGPIVKEAIRRTRHVHARIGYEQGPQVNDPRMPEWQAITGRFLQWWDAMVQQNRRLGRDVMTFTAEFGPAPYMPTLPGTRKPVSDLFEINCYMRQLLSDRYQ
ncbi:MAG: sugar phosphate isomerase/epimerase, partial [Bacteroidetes bacterium]|nr:sugar phosphate isomerase/epimerase [Bacteroidota bacterium]